MQHAATATQGPTGIGWRHAHYGALLDERPRLDFLEVHAENFFAAGGAALSMLEQARGAYGISLHGVGLALGSASFLWIMQWFFHYDTKLPSASDAIAGYRATSAIAVGVMFAICTGLLIAYQLNKRATIEMADELATRRRKMDAQQPVPETV